MLLSLMSTVMFRTFLSLQIPHKTQETLVGRMLAVLAFADVGFPSNLLYVTY